jgi:hypothetical protein
MTKARSRQRSRSKGGEHERRAAPAGEAVQTVPAIQAIPAVQAVAVPAVEAVQAVQPAQVATPTHHWWDYFKISNESRQRLKKYRTGLVLIAGALVYINRDVIPAVRSIRDIFAPSSTHVSFSGATRWTINIQLSNSGPKRSTLRNYRLRFLPLLNIATATLEPGLPLKSDVIKPRATDVEFALTAGKLELREPLTHRLYRREEVENYLCTAPLGRLRLEVDVQESNDKDGDYHVLHADPTVQQLSEFVLWRIPSHVRQD